MNSLKNLLGLATRLTTGLVLGTQVLGQVSEQAHLAENVFGQMPWRELGPVSSGGRIVDIAVHPEKPQVFWAAAGSGGLWKTTNGGTSWQPQFQDQYSISIGDIAVAPTNPDVLFVGTGEANNQRSSYWGNGVYRSRDGGETFEHVGLDGTDHVGRIAIHPDNADVIYVAALGALYRSNADRGLYRSLDGGDNWERVIDRGPDVGFVDVIFDPTDSETLFAASYERRRRAWNFEEGGAGSRLWRSRDGGDNWEQLEGGLPAGKLGRIGIDAFHRNGATLYACIENLNPVGTPNTTPAPVGEEEPRTPRDRDGDRDGDPARRIDELLPAEILADPVALDEALHGEEEAQDRARRSRRRTIGGEVYRSDDGGDTWTKTNGDTSIGGTPGYYYGQVRIDPNDAETVYVLSVPVLRSTDGGKTWTPRGRRRGNAFANGLHVDHHALWIDPRDSKHCLLGNDGGLAITWDGGDNWDHLPHLPILQAYTVAVDERSPYRIFIGLQDNGTWGFPIHGPTSSGLRAADAFKINGGDGFYTVVDPDDPDIVYSESQFGGMSRMNLRTGARQRIKPRAAKGQPRLRFNWNTPIVLSPHSSTTVYTGSQHLHRSRDRGDTWERISPDLTTDDPEKKKGDVPHCTITSISESPKREGMLFVGTDDGRVWLTKNGGQRWHDLTDRFPAATQKLWVSRVEASSHDAQVAFVSFTGYREDIRAPFVFRTDDGGETFQSIAHELPMEPINVVRQHPRQANVLFLGTEMSVFVSVDDGANWFRLGKDLPRVAVHDLVVHPREPHVLLGTHGRGVWALDASAFEGLASGQLGGRMKALPPSGGVLLPRAYRVGYVGARSWSASNPFVTPTFRYVLGSDVDDDVEIEVADVTGKVRWSTKGPKEAGYHEVKWQRSRRGGMRRAFSGFSGGGGNSGPAPGEFVVTIRLGSQESKQRFQVLDRRPASSILGPVPADEETVEEGEEHGASRRDW
ncbi:MAG: hypothetical protein NXI31_03955 [bacterium]|nr:hypothetical protein [bacterium]